ncbi:Proline dehydrogenase 1 [Chlorella vulgaris]
MTTGTMDFITSSGRITPMEAMPTPDLAVPYAAPKPAAARAPSKPVQKDSLTSLAPMLCTALARRATTAGALPALCRLLPSVSAANLHGSAAAVEQLAVANAPARMEEAAQAVKEVMGEPDPHHIQLQQEAEQPLPLAALKFDDPQAAFKAKSSLDLLRSLLVFRCCKIQPLVQNADSILAWSKRVFGTTLTKAVIKATFYKQFVAGEDAQRIQPTLRKMKASGVRAILDYAAEDDVEQDKGPASRQAPHDSVIARTYEYESEKHCDSRMSVFLKSIEAAHSAEGQGFAAIKVTALGLPNLLERTSNSLKAIGDLFRLFDTDGNGNMTKAEFAGVYSQLFTDDAPERIDEIFAHLDAGKDELVDYVDWISRISVLDTAAIASRCRSRGPFAEAALDADEQRLLRNMMRRVERLAQAAAEADVRLLVDAEHSYFQPAIDNTVTELQRTHNRTAPRIYNTCYLKDSRDRLQTEMERARRDGYKYGVKLVRGAYMVLERQRALDMGYPSPIYDTAEDTHTNYDRCVRDLLRCVEKEGVEVMVATHNQGSIELTVEQMAALGLPPSSGVFFGQLLGMADHLTYTLGANGYGAYKYVPFGAVEEVMPYLIRRAQENSSILSGAACLPAIILIEDAPPTASVHSSIVTLVNSAIGAGILALPYAFRCTGWAAGLATVFSLGAIQAYTLFVLSRHAEDAGSTTYGALVRKMLGKRASLALCAVIVVFLFLACSAFLMLIAVSSLAVFAILLVVGTVVYGSVMIVSSPGHSWAGVRAFNPSAEFFGALPLIVLSFSCHTNVISVFSELEDPPDLRCTSSSGPVQQQQQQQPPLESAGSSGYQSLPTPRLLAGRSMRRLKSSKLKSMVGVIAASISLTASLYCTTGIAGYLAFAADTKPDILLNFGSSDLLMQVARASIGLVITASYPVIHFPARAAIRELLHHATGDRFEDRWFTVAESMMWVGATLGTSLACTDLAAMFQLIGGTCGGVLMLGVPGALLMQYSYSKHRDALKLLTFMNEPLLMPAAEEEGSETGREPAQQPGPPGLLWSKLWWTGAVLQVMTVALAVLTVLTVTGVLPSP